MLWASCCAGTWALGQLVHVNVIPLNPTPGSKWDASPKPVEREFVRRVNDQGVACTVRDTRGQEIAAACGRLAAEGRPGLTPIDDALAAMHPQALAAVGVG
jgi:hypothetical protein